MELMFNWRSVLISSNASVLDSLKAIDTGAIQIVLVVDEDDKLIGTITDGDIRRALLRGVSLDNPVKEIMNRSPIVVRQQADIRKIKTLVKEHKLNHLPIVNEYGQVIGLEIVSEILGSDLKDNLVVLMAGGLGSRLHPLTEECPKPLLKVGGQPILETILKNFIEHGFYKFLISINYKGEMIEEYFADGSKWGVSINYLKESTKKGTAGALALLPEKTDKPIFVMNGDLLTKINLQHLLDFHTKHNAFATMCLREYTFQVPFGIAVTDEYHLTQICEKPAQKFFVNAGIYLLNPEVVDFIPTNTSFDMPELFNKLIKENYRTIAFPIREYWLDIGRMGDFERANLEFTEVFG